MVMLFTSGTTGRSKAVMLAERNFFTVMQMHVAMGDHMLDFKHRKLPEDKNDVLSNFAILPLFHLVPLSACSPGPSRLGPEPLQ